MNKRMLVIPFVTILAFSIVGIAFAAWSDSVEILGTAKMGILTLAFDYVEPPDCEEYWFNHTSGQLVKGEYLDKDVGYCEAYYTDYIKDEHSGKEGYKTMIINVTNAYPQYFVHTTFIVRNIGTIPIHLVNFTIKETTGGLIFIWIVKPPASPALGLFYKDFNNNTAYDKGEEIINVKLVNFVCVQLDPCNSTKGEIDIDFKQPAEECHDYTFKFELVGIQWNKYKP